MHEREVAAALFSLAQDHRARAGEARSHIRTSQDVVRERAEREGTIWWPWSCSFWNEAWERDAREQDALAEVYGRFAERAWRQLAKKA